MDKHLDEVVRQTETFTAALALDIQAMQVRGAVSPFEPNAAEESLALQQAQEEAARREGPPQWKVEATQPWAEDGASQTSLLSSLGTFHDMFYVFGFCVFCVFFLFFFNMRACMFWFLLSPELFWFSHSESEGVEDDMEDHEDWAQDIESEDFSEVDENSQEIESVC
jgi:hypothetical protein